MPRRTEDVDEWIGWICVIRIQDNEVMYVGSRLTAAAEALEPGTTYCVSGINQRAAMVGARRNARRFRRKEIVR